MDLLIWLILDSEFWQNRHLCAPDLIDFVTQNLDFIHANKSSNV